MRQSNRNLGCDGDARAKVGSNSNRLVLFFIIDPHPVQPCLGVTEPDLNSPPTACGSCKQAAGILNKIVRGELFKEVKIYDRIRCIYTLYRLATISASCVMKVVVSIVGRLTFFHSNRSFFLPPDSRQ